MTKETIKYLRDYQKPDYSVSTVNLTLDLKDEETIVTNEMSVMRNSWASDYSPLILDGNEIVLVDVFVDNRKLAEEEYKILEDKLEIYNLPKEFLLKVVNKIYPQKNTSLEGLYLAGDAFLTQCEPNGFSKISYALDRPDVMSIFTTKLIADKKFPILLSNGDKIDSGSLSSSRHFAVWHDKSKKPTYLFAAVFADMEVLKDNFITKSGKQVALEIYSTKNEIKHTDYGMYSLKSSMTWDEKTFNREYDLDTYMIVATPHFNSGAMENKGLNIFNTKYVIASKDTSTDQDFMNVFGVIGHEYFHNWTGNRITLRDWFQLSLKEGLTVFRDQEFTASEFSSAICRIDDANMLRMTQFIEDSGPLSHPVKPESYIKMDNFYTTTVYEKGAEVVRMLKTLLGEENFAKGMDLYFKKYDGLAITTEDFIAAFEEVNNIELSQFKLWYSQSGTPNLDIKGEYNEKSKEYKLNIEQQTNPTPGQPTKQPFVIPIKIGLISSKSGKELDFKYEDEKKLETVLKLTKQSQEFVLKEVNEEPIPSILRDFSAPVKVNYKYTDHDLSQLLAHDSNAFNKWDMGQRYFQQYLLQLTSALINKIHLSPPATLINSLKEVINNSEDQALLSRQLLLPREKILQYSMDMIFPIEIFEARKFLNTYISKELNETLLNLHQRLAAELSSHKYDLKNKDIGARALKSLCLNLLSYNDTELAESIAKKQLENSDNLTDRLDAFKILIDSKNDKVYEEAYSKFFTKWCHEELCLYHFISHITSSKRSDTLTKTNQLMQKSFFDIKTPNMVFSAVRGIANNTSIFHNIDGSGYKWLANLILDLDEINPKTSARLVAIFNNWKKFEIIRKDLIQKELIKISNSIKLSSNTREITEKMLSN